MMPIMRDRYPDLARFIAVNTDEDRKRFEAVGMRPVVNRTIPQGIATAAAVLRSRHVEESKIKAAYG